MRAVVYSSGCAPIWRCSKSASRRIRGIDISPAGGDAQGDARRELTAVALVLVPDRRNPRRSRVGPLRHCARRRTSPDLDPMAVSIRCVPDDWRGRGSALLALLRGLSRRPRVGMDGPLHAVGFFLLSILAGLCFLFRKISAGYWLLVLVTAIRLRNHDPGLPAAREPALHAQLDRSRLSVPARKADPPASSSRLALILGGHPEARLGMAVRCRAV